MITPDHLPILFWLDLALLIFAGIVAGGTILATLGMGPDRAVNRGFALFATFELAWVFVALNLRLTLLARAWEFEAVLLHQDPSRQLAVTALLQGLAAATIFYFISLYLDIQSQVKRWFVTLAMAAMLVVFFIKPLAPLWTDVHLSPIGLVAKNTQSSALLPWGALLSILGWTTWLLLQNWQHLEDHLLPIGIFILIAGYLLSGFFNFPFPVLSLSVSLSMAFMGYAILRRQILNPLKEQKEELQNQVNERKQAESSLKQALADKSVLLREVHHRVNNNLQVLVSLINLQLRSPERTANETALLEFRNRVYSMAVIHDRMYRESSYSAVQMAAFIRMLIAETQRNSGTLFAVEQDLAKIELPIDIAVPCSLILNEVFQLALQNGDTSLTIRTRLLEGEEQVLIEMKNHDPTVGVPVRAGHADPGFGEHLVEILLSQINGRLESQQEECWLIRIHFPLKQGTNHLKP